MVEQEMSTASGNGYYVKPGRPRLRLEYAWIHDQSSTSRLFTIYDVVVARQCSAHISVAKMLLRASYSMRKSPQVCMYLLIELNPDRQVHAKSPVIYFLVPFSQIYIRCVDPSSSKLSCNTRYFKQSQNEHRYWIYRWLCHLPWISRGQLLLFKAINHNKWITPSIR